MLALTLAACGGAGSTLSGSAASPILIDQVGALAATDSRLGNSYADRYDIPIRSGERIVVEVNTAEFNPPLDPKLQVTLPNGQSLDNDDWQGSRTLSHVEFAADQTGIAHIVVYAYTANATGQYHITARREGANGNGIAITAGQTAQGELGPGDTILSDGTYMDEINVTGDQQAQLRVRVTSLNAHPMRVLVTDALGRMIMGSPSGDFALFGSPHYRVQVMGAREEDRVTYQVAVAGPAPSATATPIRPGQAPAIPAPTQPAQSAHHRVDPATIGAGTPIAIGAAAHGTLGASATHLPSGESADVYSLTLQPGQSARVDLASAAFDSFLVVRGPQPTDAWEDDDGGGGHNSSIALNSPTGGTYRIVVTSYRSGEAGAYDLRVNGGVAAAAANANASANASQNTASAAPFEVRGPRVSGSLAQGAAQLQSGEFSAHQSVHADAGTTLHVRLTSTDFNPYLIVTGPNHEHFENNDFSRDTHNAGVDIPVATTGDFDVIITTDRPGEAGAYELIVAREAGQAASPNTVVNVSNTNALPVPAAATNGQEGGTIAVPSEQHGSLTQADQRLSSGEFAHPITVRFAPGSSTRIRMIGQGIDSFLIVRTPSGAQLTNDDASPDTHDAAIDIPLAEAGDYTVAATTYGAGVTGNYTLRFEPGHPIPGGAAAGGQTAHLYGIFAGISDYPDPRNHLDECANDARKMVETLNTDHLIEADKMVLLTDGQATTANVRAAFQRFAQTMTPNDLFVFFYSGHGGQRHIAAGSDPHEIDDINETIVLYDAQMPDDDMGHLFDSIHPRLSLLALDSCFSGGFAKDVITRPGRIGMFSSEEDVTSGVASNFHAGGYLSYFLREGMTGDADDAPRDRVLSVGELTHYVWRQFGEHANDVRMSTGYQHLVIDRGAVSADAIMWAYR